MLKMNETCDRCGPAVRAVYRVTGNGELYLCGHCAGQLLSALSVQGWFYLAHWRACACATRQVADRAWPSNFPREIRLPALVDGGLCHWPHQDTQLFLSPRTVEWHLHKVFTKLGISSRIQLHRALPDPGPRVLPA